MCGLVGVLTTHKMGLFGSQLDTFEQLLLVGMVRGFDGTGIMKITKTGCQIRKAPSHTLALFSSPKYNAFHVAGKDENIMGLLGHNRLATKGQHIPSHTHPFREGHISLAHNGTLTSWDDLPAPDKKKFEVDSHALCYSISQIGLQETISNCWGAMALTWYDSKKNTINLYRNSQRPLVVARHNNNQDIIYASESRMMHWIMDRTNQTLNSWKFAQLPDDVHMEINLSNGDVIQKEVKRKSHIKIWPSSKENYHGYPENEFLGDDVPFHLAADEPVKIGPPRKSKLALLIGGAHVLADMKKKAKTIEKPKVGKNGRYSEVKELQGYQKEDTIVFKIRDYDKLEKNDEQGFVIVGERPDIPDIQIRAIIQTNKQLDRLIEAKYVSGIVVTCLYDQEPEKEGKKKDNIIWLRFVNPVGQLAEASDERGKKLYEEHEPGFVELAEAMGHTTH